MITTQMPVNEIHEALKKARVNIQDWGKKPGSNTLQQFDDDIQKCRIIWDERNPTVIVKDVAVVTINHIKGDAHLQLIEAGQVFRDGFKLKHKLDGSIGETMLHDEVPSVTALRALQKLSQTRPEFNSVSVTALTSNGISDSIPHLMSYQYPGLYVELIRRKFSYGMNDAVLFSQKYDFTEFNKTTTFVWK